MYRRIAKSLLAMMLVTVVSSSYSFGQSASGKSGWWSIGKDVSYFEDTTNSLTVEDVSKVSVWNASGQAIPNLGVSDNFFWVKFKLPDEVDEEHAWLEIDNPNIDHLELFVGVNDRGELLGEVVPFYARKDHSTAYRFDLSGSVPDEYLYLKVAAAEQILLPMTIGSQEVLVFKAKNRDLFMGVYCGIMLVMAFYNLFIFLTVRDRSYLYYVAYILTIALAQITLQGYGFKYLWPDSTWFATRSIFFFSSLSGIALILFTNHFLQTSQYLPKISKVGWLIVAIYSVDFVMALFGDLHVCTNLTDLGAGLITLYVLTAAILVARKGFRPAKFFLLAWSIFIVGVVIFVLRNSSVLPMGDLTNFTMPVGTAVETILISFALADRINILKREKEESQVEALRVSQENERIIREQNVMLEQKVDERTTMLQEANEELNVTLTNLKQAQSQLVDAEKMASIGQLTAGIAHEINNPINFVTSNVIPLRRDLEDLIEVLGAYGEIKDEETLKEDLQKVNDLKEEIEIDYVIDEMNQLLTGIDEGANRTAEIIRGLRNFSRLDENDLKEASLNEGLSSTLVLLNSSLKGDYTVVKNFGQIPLVECYAGKLNQVFMNILNNGIHACKDEEKPTITVSTELVGEEVVVRLADNGTGIPEDIREKMFEPFYTTKEVGEGTGLGLSIVNNIVESHSGKMEVNSELGKGTEFVITLPIKQLEVVPV